jgi:hypothetical protein
VKNSGPAPDPTLPRSSMAGAPAVGIDVEVVKVPDGVTVAGVVKLPVGVPIGVPVGVTVADGPLADEVVDPVGPVGSEVLPSPEVDGDDADPEEPVAPVEPSEPVDSEVVSCVEVVDDDVIDPVDDPVESGGSGMNIVVVAAASPAVIVTPTVVVT